MRRTIVTTLLLAFAPLGLRAQGGLLISELLYQPVSGEAEYVELYNSGGEPLNLKDYHIVRWVGDSLGRHYELPDHEVAAHDYAVLTKDAASVAAHYEVRFPGKVVECRLPTYPNAGGSVVLCTADSTPADRLDYSPAMHSRLLRNKAGVALERRRFDVPASDPANWLSAASTAGYGTPGYANSQSTERLAEERAFSFSSTLLSPDGDGYQDRLDIGYELPEGDLYARAEVYDRRGQPVRRLLNNALLGAHGSFSWDGTSDHGEALPAGHYVVLITLYDLGGTQQVLRRTVAILYH